MIRKLLITSFCFLGVVFAASAQQRAGSRSTLPKLAIKTNLLYGAGTLTPNLGMELGLGTRTSLDIMGGYNPWNLDGSNDDNKKLVHWYVQPELRWWTCERFDGHFFGLHALGGMYNIGQHSVPMIGGKLFEKEYRYEGWAAGGGVSYGYHWIWSPRWSMEFTAGLGYIYFDFDRYGCQKCDRQVDSGYKHYFGPTKLGISLIFTIR